MTRYRELFPGEIDRALFRHFIRRQIVTKCWRKEGAKWVSKISHLWTIGRRRITGL